jgi:glyoxylase-like metal-dependent hydrolase (beta-lactamase superfamily II)
MELCFSRPVFFNMAPKLEAALKTIFDKTVKSALNTHWQPDHAETIVVFKKEGAIIIDQNDVLARMQTGSSTRIPYPDPC